LRPDKIDIIIKEMLGSVASGTHCIIGQRCGDSTDKLKAYKRKKNGDRGKWQ